MNRLNPFAPWTRARWFQIPYDVRRSSTRSSNRKRSAAYRRSSTTRVLEPVVRPGSERRREIFASEIARVTSATRIVSQNDPCTDTEIRVRNFQTPDGCPRPVARATAMRTRVGGVRPFGPNLPGGRGGYGGAVRSLDRYRVTHAYARCVYTVISECATDVR